jgi:hypothetical protein
MGLMQESGGGFYAGEQMLKDNGRMFEGELKVNMHLMEKCGAWV